MTAARGAFFGAQVVGLTALLVASGGVGAATKAPRPGKSTATKTTKTNRVAAAVAVESAYSGALSAGWADYGWSPTRRLGGGPAQIDLSAWSGWILARTSGSLDPALFSELQFRFRPDRDAGSFMQVSLRSGDGDAAADVPVTNVRAGADGWSVAHLSMRVLAPSGASFDRIVIRPLRNLSSPFVVAFDQISLVRAGTSTGLSAANSAPIAASADARPVAMSIDCAANRRPISPLIYGVGFAGASNSKEIPWSLNLGSNRWGGNPTSRYNWELGNAWNTASDYYFRNVAINDSPNAADAFLSNNATRGIVSALTVPMIGWVAKDASSYSFPVSQFGQQNSTDPSNPDIGNGVGGSGKELSTTAQRTSVASTPESIGRWVAKVRGRVGSYILDNEPDLWDSTHRDVHPDPVTYDELLQRTVAYASEVRRNDPGATIAGPASWGWPGYFYSAADAKAGFDKAPDRNAHGGVPLIPWYLREVRAAERRTGLKLLDLLDVHFYPQGANVAVNGGGGGTDAATAALRIRSTRALWDPTYKDESWIDANVQLIPRLRQWIADNAPGVGISIGEWNFGGENHISGGLATAEALGRFGQLGVTSAYYWTAPPNDSPSYWGFRAFRNVDGKGLRFLDTSVGTRMGASTSLFASTDVSTNELVAIVLNMDPTQVTDAQITTTNCKRITTFQTYTYDGSPAGFVADGAQAAKGDALSVRVKPYSITVIHADLR